MLKWEPDLSATVGIRRNIMPGFFFHLVLVPPFYCIRVHITTEQRISKQATFSVVRQLSHSADAADWNRRCGFNCALPPRALTGVSTVRFYSNVPTLAHKELNMW